MRMRACRLLGKIHGNATIIENCIATVTVLLNNYGERESLLFQKLKSRIEQGWPKEMKATDTEERQKQKNNATIIENYIATVTVLLNNYGDHKKEKVSSSRKCPVPETEELKRARMDKRNEGDRYRRKVCSVSSFSFLFCF